MFVFYRFLSISFIFYAGNADGIGNIRKEELYKTSAILKVRSMSKEPCRFEVGSALSVFFFFFK